MPKHATHEASRCEWRRFGRYLWAGTSESGPVGTIEQGRRYAAIDVGGVVVARCKQLEDAQGLLEHLAESRHASRGADEFQRDRLRVA
jgi:hypothetical protein